MLNVSQENASLLALYGITLKKELKSSVTLQLKDHDEDSKMSKSLYEKLIEAINSKQPHDVSLPLIYFGVELEFVGSMLPMDVQHFCLAMHKLVGEKFFNSYNYTHNSGNAWILGRDGSIKASESELLVPVGYELSTPKLELFNKEHLELLRNVIDLCKTHLHAEVNKSCGTHVHFGFRHDKVYRGGVRRLLTSYSVMESKVFDPMVPTSRRRNKYCKTIKPYTNNKYQKISTRYCEFNCDGKCRLLHFEFRQLEGTLDINTIMYWTELNAYLLYDLIDNIKDNDYLDRMSKMNLFDILFHYNFNSSLISFFIDRVINFKSKTIQAEE